jgi:hypothetical protein
MVVEGARPVFRHGEGPTTGDSSISLSSATPSQPRDRRYGSRRWRITAKAVLDRDLHVCRIVKGCPRRAAVADHIIPVYDGMPDALFFDPRNLRAGCRPHNTARGVAARLDRETREAESEVITSVDGRR